MIDKDDWRLMNDVGYLMNAEIDPVGYEEIVTYRPQIKHCVFCWEQVPQKLSYYQTWYVPLDKSCAICENCFKDFREQFNWKLLDGYDVEW